MNRKPMYIVLSSILAATLAMPLQAGEAADKSADAARTTGQVIDDMSIAARLKAALASDPVTDAIDIDIEVDRDKVQLNGFVDSEAERLRAVEIARGLEGVASVSNNLALQPHDRTTGEYVDDKLLVTKVKAELADDPLVGALAIDVESDHGVISLGGHVDSEAERLAAAKAARRVAGVTGLINNLEVRS